MSRTLLIIAMLVVGAVMLIGGMLLSLTPIGAAGVIVSFPGGVLFGSGLYQAVTGR